MTNYSPTTTVRVDVLIASGGTDSATVNLLGARLVGAYIPGTFEGTSLSLLGVAPNGSYVPVYTSGSLYSEAVGTSRYVTFDPLVTLGLREIKIKSNTTVLADRTLTLVAREV